MLKIFKKVKLLSKILALEKSEPNDFVFAGKVRNLIDHFKETGEIKQNPKGRTL